MFVKEKIETLEEKLIIFSTFLFALSIPISVALDNVAAGIGILGLILLFISGKVYPLPPLKKFTFLLTPQVLETLLRTPSKVFKTDLNQHFIPYFTVYKTLTLKSNYLHKLLNVLVISSCLLAFSVIFEAFTWQNIKHINFDTLSFHTNIIRSKGFLDNALTTGGVLYLLLVLFLGFFLLLRKKRFLFSAIFLFLALLLCGSRSYWVGFSIFISLVILWILFSRKKIKDLLFITLPIIIIGSVFLSTPLLKHRLYSIIDVKTNGSNMIRLALWRAHLKAFSYHYSFKEKFFGAGYKASEYAWKEYPESVKEIFGREFKEERLKKIFFGGLTHNIYLKYLTKYGIIGLLGYLAFWGFIFHENLKRKNQTDYKVLINTLLAGYVGFLIAGFFENNFTDAEVQFALMFVLGVNFFLLNFSGKVRDERYKKEPK
ncbi:MAG: O-antigen ligase family protein [Desulfurobacteriaceae bacterium]